MKLKTYSFSPNNDVFDYEYFHKKGILLNLKEAMNKPTDIHHDHTYYAEYYKKLFFKYYNFSEPFFDISALISMDWMTRTSFIMGFLQQTSEEHNYIFTVYDKYENLWFKKNDQESEDSCLNPPDIYVRYYNWVGKIGTISKFYRDFGDYTPLGQIGFKAMGLHSFKF